MKNTQILALFIIGAIFVAIGIVFRIYEWPLASLFLIIGMTFEAVTTILVFLKLLKKNKSDSFLDS